MKGRGEEGKTGAFLDCVCGDNPEPNNTATQRASSPSPLEKGEREKKRAVSVCLIQREQTCPGTGLRMGASGRQMSVLQAL